MISAQSAKIGDLFSGQNIPYCDFISTTEFYNLSLSIQKGLKPTFNQSFIENICVDSRIKVLSCLSQV